MRLRPDLFRASIRSRVKSWNYAFCADSCSPTMALKESKNLAHEADWKAGPLTLAHDQRYGCAFLRFMAVNLAPNFAASPDADCGRYGANLWSVTLAETPASRTISRL